MTWPARRISPFITTPLLPRLLRRWFNTSHRLSRHPPPPSVRIGQVQSVFEQRSRASLSLHWLLCPPLMGEADDVMAPPSLRNMTAAMRAVQDLQRAGGKLIEAAQSRHRVVAMMRGYMQRLAIEPDALPPVIHIAGTKGKGSTAAMCESILRTGGLRTGLFTSPHLISVRERFRLDGAPVSEELYLRYFWQTWDGLAEAGGRGDPSPDLPSMPGFFHFLTLLAFQIFRGERVDVAVMEVGMGGRLDATNVVAAPVVCGVTTLDFDHMDVLGHTLPLIAAEKGGIFKRGVPAVTVPQRDDALGALRRVAEEAGAPLLLADVESLDARRGGGGGGSSCSSSRIELGLDGSFQRTNAALAVALSEIFMWRQGREGVVSAVVPPWQRELLAYGVPPPPSTSAARSGVADAAGLSDKMPGAASALGGGAAADSASALAGSYVGTVACTAPSDCVSSTADSPPQALPPALLRYDAGGAPLPVYVREGLRDTRWTGRAQIVRVSSGEGAPMVLRSAADSAAPASCGVGAGPPPITFYVDGAHTERSLQECVAWFRARCGESSDSSSNRNSEAGAGTPSGGGGCSDGVVSAASFTSPPPRPRPSLLLRHREGRRAAAAAAVYSPL